MEDELQTLARHSWERDWEDLGVRRVLTAPIGKPAEPKPPVHVEFSDHVAKYVVQIHHAPQYHMSWFVNGCIEKVIRNMT